MGLKVVEVSRAWEPYACWNQTKMGLKDAEFVVAEAKHYIVEIRPRWDWKEIVLVRHPLDIDELKSDQDGIERAI